MNKLSEDENHINPHAAARKSKKVAVILVVIFGLFGWLYTYKYKRDRIKFWLNLILAVVTFSLWGIVAWAWAIIDRLSKPAGYFKNYPAYKPTAGLHHSNKRWVGWLIIGIAILIAILWKPVSGDITIVTADPTMVKLAQDAGMSRKGELLFLKADPQLVSDSEIGQECPDAQTNSDGFIEQGCYVPSTNRIYLRQMPASLYNLEVSTAAYEMLHPAYINIVNSSQGNGATLNQAIESNYEAIDDSNLKSQVANFAKTEPGARDLELFSLLGTGYSNLSASLTNYYAPYFDNIEETIAANNQVTQLFQSDESQLAQLQSTITNDNSEANTAYANSVSWADAGNQYEDDYNYNIYSQDI